MDPRLLFLAFAAVPELPRRHAQALLQRFGSPAAVFGRAPSQLRGWCTPGAAAALARGPDLERARGELARADDLGLRVLVPGTPDFPGLLAAIPDPPLVLWLRGLVPGGSSLAIVGARRATPRGREMARRLAAAAAEAGVCVVSGLAYGIDAAAHAGALAAGGASVAVLASGLDLPSPSGNVRLAERLLEGGGGWLSEYPPGTPASPFRFPERNRLISGLCQAVLVVEAGEKSGSLWTVRHALDQGRDVLGVPGPVDTASCRGSNRLLRDGATVVLEPADLPLPRPLQAGEAKPRPHPSSTASRVLEALESQPMTPDELSRRLSLPPDELAAPLLELELSGRVARAEGRLLPTRR